MRGFGAVKQAVEEAKERGSSGDGAKLSFFSWKDGQSINLRFLDDNPIVVGMHSFTKSIDGKNRNFVCPTNLDKEDGFEPWDCPICATYKRKGKDGNLIPVKPSSQTIGWAVEREFVGLGNIKDVMTEVDGVKVPKIGIVSQSNRLFWEFMLSFYARYGTIVDRDYEIKRMGEKLDTKYQPMQHDPIDDLRTQEDIDKRYGEAMELFTSPTEYVKFFSSKEYINKHVIPGGNFADGSPQEDVTASREVAGAPDDSGTFETLKDRMKAYAESNAS